MPNVIINGNLSLSDQRPVARKSRVQVESFQDNMGPMAYKDQAEALAQFGNWVRPVSQGDIAACLSDQVANANAVNNRALTLDYSKGQCVLREYGQVQHRGDAEETLAYLADLDRRSPAMANFLAMEEHDASGESMFDAMVFGGLEGEIHDAPNFCPRAWEEGNRDDIADVL
jgi:hypothetical protein